MQEPANMPLLVMCQVEEMKQLSTVYQFQSIWTVRKLHGRLRSLLQGYGARLEDWEDSRRFGSCYYPCPYPYCSKLQRTQRR